jgi:anionic cell wall polymer biosynthesis LytR-Cps2A-Psr (LCP) family protein
VSTVVGVMDRPGWRTRTDNIVVVRPRRRELVFVPRDLWSTLHGDRINTVFAHAGHEAFRTALREYGLRVSSSLCVRREAAGVLADRVDVEIPVTKALRFRYQHSPLEPIEDGWRWIEFNPPAERLRGERVHQWLQARFAPDPFIAGDIRRIERQQAFVAALLSQGFPFGDVLDLGEDMVSMDGDPLADLRRVRSDWRMRTVGPVVPATIDGRKVILQRRWPGFPGRREVARRASRLGGELDP